MVFDEKRIQGCGAGDSKKVNKYRLPPPEPKKIFEQKPQAPKQSVIDWLFEFRRKRPDLTGMPNDEIIRRFYPKK